MVHVQGRSGALEPALGTLAPAACTRCRNPASIHRGEPADVLCHACLLDQRSCISGGPRGCCGEGERSWGRLPVGLSSSRRAMDLYEVQSASQRLTTRLGSAMPMMSAITDSIAATDRRQMVCASCAERSAAAHPYLIGGAAVTGSGSLSSSIAEPEARPSNWRPPSRLHLSRACCLRHPKVRTLVRVFFEVAEQCRDLADIGMPTRARQSCQRFLQGGMGIDAKAEECRAMATHASVRASPARTSDNGRILIHLRSC